MLYSIQFLHQITTGSFFSIVLQSCIVSNFYIKSQRRCSSANRSERCIVSNFYIKSQREVPKIDEAERCIVSNFYIKSQLLRAKEKLG